MAALPPVEPLRALYSSYQSDFAGELILQALQTWVDGEMALSATRFEQARDSFDQTDSPQEWAILDEWVNAAADLFLEQAEAAIAAGREPSYKEYREEQHARGKDGKWTKGPDQNAGAQPRPATVAPAAPAEAQPTSPAPSTRKLSDVVRNLESKYYDGSDAKRLGWSPEEFGQIVTGIEKTFFAVGRTVIPTTMQQAQSWADAGELKPTKAQFSLTTDALVNLVVDTQNLEDWQAEIDGQDIPAQEAARVLAAKYAGTMSHVYAPALADTFRSGYLPFWLARNMAIVMGDRIKGVPLKPTKPLKPDAVRGIVVLGKVGGDIKKLSQAFQVGVVQGDSSDDLMDEPNWEELKPKPMAEKVKKAITLSTLTPAMAHQRALRAWETRRARYGYSDAKYRLKAAQRGAGGVPSRYTAGRFAQLASAMRQAAARVREKARAERRADHQDRMSGGRTLKELVSAQIRKHLGGPDGTAPHPDGTPQSVHSGEWKKGIGGILREKVRERVEQVKLKTGETKDKTVIDFKYTYAGTQTELTPEDLDYVKKLGIGPAYTNVRINPDFKTDGLVAEYEDSKGRSVRLYSKAHSQAAAQEKFERLKAFNDAMPAMQAQIRKDIDSPDPKVRAAARVLYLVEQTAFRIGSDRDTGADKQAYGASTLQVRHAKVKGDKITFSFVGKKGVDIKQKITDATLARLVTEQQTGRNPSDKLWDADDGAVRTYLDTLPAAKDFLVKDFRTWNATRWALAELEGVKKFDDEKAFAKFQKEVAVTVSSRLGNTPVMALGSYIDPHVWDAVRQPQWGAWVPNKLK